MILSGIKIFLSFRCNVASLSSRPEAKFSFVTSNELTQALNSWVYYKNKLQNQVSSGIKASLSFICNWNVIVLTMRGQMKQVLSPKNDLTYRVYASVIKTSFKTSFQVELMQPNLIVLNTRGQIEFVLE